MSGFKSDVLAVVGGIQEILLAVDGPTVVREIVQNADDAKAERLVFAIIDERPEDVDNSLLKGPALLAVNDGAFSARNHEAIRKTRGGPKTGDTETIGRFGIGLKSVYYLCESFIYIGAENGTTRADVLDPWARDTKNGDYDPLHKDWNTVTDRDKCRLSAKASALLGGCFDNGLLLWIPLRSSAHANRGPDESELGLSTYYPETKHVRDWFREPATLALLLSQCGYLQSINAVTLGGVSRLRPQPSWVGRYKSDTERPGLHCFKGVIKSIRSRYDRWSVTGVEVLGLDSLRAISSNQDWPEVLKEDSDGTFKKGPREALAHSAITVLHRENQERAGVRIHWAVYLPLNDAPQSKPVPVGARGSDSWDIVMHGAFWPEQNRRSIPGATGTDDDRAKSVEARMRFRWNRTLRDELLLPLLPQALERATGGGQRVTSPERVSEAAARMLIEHVRQWSLYDTHCRAITSSHMLVPVITETGLQWKAFTEDTCFYAVPEWKQVPDGVRNAFTRKAGQSVFVADDPPRIGGKPSAWPVEQVKLLLGSISCETLGTPEGLDWTAGFVHYVLSWAGASRPRSAAAASWLAKRVGDGALTAAIDGPHEQREKLQRGWWRLYDALPPDWLIDAHEDSAPAVAEIARAGIVGEGLLPIPLDRRTNPLPPRRRRSQPNAERLDDALRCLGNGLNDHDVTNRPEYRARLLLSDALLRVRDGGGFNDELARSPVFRVLCLPKNRDEAWSLIQLRGAVKQHRAFAGKGGAPRQAVDDLASALGESVYLVSPMLAGYAEVPSVTADALACSVLTSLTIRSEPKQRIPLLKRLGRSYTETVGHAMRILLTGENEAARDSRLYYVPQGEQHKTKQKTLRILLRLRDEPWREVKADLIGGLEIDTLPELNLGATDNHVLHELLRGIPAERWSQIKDEDALHLLKHLYGQTPDERIQWKRMPLHRGIDGKRYCIDDQTLLAAEDLTDDEISAIQGELQIRLIVPDEGINELYDHVVDPLGCDGVLRALLRADRPHSFARKILTLLSDGLPGVDVCALLKERPWLPALDDGGVAPAQVIDLPGELLELVKPLSEAIGRYRLADTVVPAVWESARNVVHELLGQPNRSQWLERFAGALDPASVAMVDNGAYVILPCYTNIDFEMIKGAMSTPLASQHLGWRVVGATRIGNSVGASTLAVARALRGHVPPNYQRAALNAAAASAPVVGDPAYCFCVFLVRSFARTPEFFESVLGDVKLPTQDGWRPSCEVAKSPFGVARRHRVVDELRDVLRATGEEDQEAPVPAGQQGGAQAAVEILSAYFESWSGRVPETPVGAFLSILGSGSDMSNLATAWLQNDTVAATVRRSLTEVTDPWRYLNAVTISVADQVHTVQRFNVLGVSNSQGGTRTLGLVLSLAKTFRCRTCCFPPELSSWPTHPRRMSCCVRSLPPTTRFWGQSISVPLMT